MRIQSLHVFRQAGWLRWLLLPVLAALLRANSVYDVVSTSPSHSTYWKRSDIVLSSRDYHDRPTYHMVSSANVPLEMDTFEAADAFFANRIEWVYIYQPADFPMLTEAQNRGIKMSVTLNTILRDDPNQPYGSWTYTRGRTTNVLNKPASRPDLLSAGTLQGCARNPAYRQIWLTHAKWLIDKNPTVITTLQMDDVAMNIQYLENGGCYCDHCNIGFRSYISTNLTSAQRTAAGITDVNTFSYRDYLRNLGQPATEKISVGTPELKDAYVAYQTANTLNFYDEVHQSLTNYYQRKIFFAANNRGGGNTPLEARHDQLIQEYSTADPHAIYDTIVDHATYSGKPLLLTYDRDLEVFNNRLFAASCYAAGGNGIVPWDVFSGVTEYTANQPAHPRFFGTRKDFAPIYGFVKALSHYLDEYDDAGMFIKTRSDPRYSTPPVIIEDNASVVVFVRAQVDPFAPVVVHIIRKDPTDTSPVTFTLNPDALFHEPIKKTLYTIPAFDQTVHNNARTTGNYSALARNSTTAQMTDVSVTQFQIPAFDLWAMLVLEPTTGNLIQPSIQTRRLKVEPQQEVQILNSGKGTIRYTLNGTEPTETSTIYTAPFVISSAATIKAKSFLNGVSTPTSTAVVQSLPYFDIAADPSTRLWLRPNVDLANLTNKAPVTAWVPTKGPTLRPTTTALPTGKPNTPPTYTTNGLGGLPGVYFNGTNSIAASGLMNLYGISKEFTVIMTTMADDGEFGLSGNAIQGGGSVPRFFMQRQLFTYGDPAVLVSIPSGYGVELTTVRMTAAGQIDVFKNGGKLGTAKTAIATSFGGGNFAVPYGVSTKVPEGVLGEVIVMSRALTDQELESIHQLRQAKPSAVPTSSVPTVDEGFLLTLNLTNIFPNVPLANSTFSYAEGPSGISVSGEGVLTWTPTEAQGPSTNTLGIRITQTSPSQVYTNYMGVIVRELNASPELTAPPTLTVNEGSTLSFQLSALDSDVPNNTLSYAKVSGPPELTVSSTGLITWATTEASGPSTNLVSVRVLDNGVPIRSDIQQIEVIVNEVNVAPVAVAPATQAIDQFLPLNLQLTATDADVPANGKTFALITGPAGATISPTGLAQWVPADNQAPSTNTFIFSVTDNGDPALSATGSFTVIASAVTQRLAWQVGVDEPAGISATLYYDEFRIQNNVNDAKPGRVTRVSGDPEYNATSNPVQDDDFYTAGIYPAGFNGLTAMLRVPFDEPSSAWEYNHTLGDRTNRLHFRLSAAQVDPATTLRIVVDLPVGGWSINGVAQSTFGDHDYVIRFVNGLGVGTNVYAGRISKATILSVIFTAGAAQATLGANTLEFVRTGPAATGASYYLIYDHLRLEVDPGGNSAPVFASVPTFQTDEQVAWSQQMGATDVDLPTQALTYTLLNGPPGLAVNSTGLISWTPTEAQGPNTYSFAVKITDNGVPALSTTNTFQVAVREVNTPPVAQAAPLQYTDKFMPLNLQLVATDGDAPPNLLSYNLVSGPLGVTISTSGLAQWMPIASQIPSTNVVTYTVTDSGIPALTTTNSFTVVARPVESRYLWLVGTNHPAGTAASTTYSELGIQNNVNDPKPGNVTLSPGDPGYTAPNTPARDDDFYFKGIYPAGFNGLTTNRVVYSDEPWSAWEYNHTLGDRTNRMHFRLNQAEILSGSVLTLSFEFTSAGFSINGVSQAPQVGSHDFVVRFINGNGLQTQVYAATVTTLRNIVVTIPVANVQATLGANSLEFVRTGPALTGYSYYLIYDYVRLESNAGSNTIPEPTPVATITTDEGVPLSRTLTATDADTPAQALIFSKVSGPAGLTIGSNGSLAWNPTKAQGPSTNTVVARVTDNGSPALSSDFQFTIIVRAVNTTPFPVVMAQTNINELVSWSLNLASSNGELPANTLNYELINGPLGLSVSSSGLVSWLPGENQGPSTSTISVRVTDDGTQPLSATNEFVVVVSEVNTAPSINPVPQRDVGEGATLAFNLSSLDADIPANALVFQLVSGPADLTVSSSGRVVWTPGEDQGPSNAIVTVKVTDNGSPALSSTNQFTVIVREINTTPTLGTVPIQTIDAESSMNLLLLASDSDLPPNGFTYSLVSGPAGLTVSTGGTVAWSPTVAFAGSTNTVVVKVTDNGTSPLSDTESFVVIVTAQQARSLWRIGVDDVDPVNPEGEFGTPNGLVDAAPGTVTIPPGGLNYSASANPSADDDFYFAGEYPAGYYGNSSVLNVAVDEPSSAWESRLTSSDPRNRFHFLLDPAQTGISARLILAVELPTGGVTVDGIPQSEFGDHPLVIRFRNSTGAVTPIYSNTISTKTRLVLDIPAESVAASAGANSIEFEQSGGAAPNTDSWLAFDFVKMESIINFNTPPVFGATADLTLNELASFALNLTATDSDTYSDVLVFGLISGPPGLTVASNGRLAWTPGEADGPSTNIVMVRVTDNGVPPLSATNTFTIIVREVNLPPQINVVSAQTVDELTLLTVNVSATDPDVPKNILTFSLANPPPGAAITPDGLFTWTPTEVQGPAVSNITVVVTDSGTPPMSATHQFPVTVNEVNVAPVLTSVPNQTLAFPASLAIKLSATDPDAPTNTLTYGLVSGPVGLTVGASGSVDWIPEQAQNPSTNTVVVKVTDNGSPNLSSTNSFSVLVSDTTDRAVWALGINHPPGTSTGTTYSEFSAQNNINDARPGKVTRLVGDPLYVAATNPGADDDFYMAGTYPSGFNGLTSTLVVPNDEPWKSWEYNHTLGDRTNRLHFPLTAAQIVPGSVLRLSFEFTSMGATIGGVVQGKGTHDFVVNFRNAAGVTTTIYSQQLSALTNIVLTFPATSVAASAGGNTLEFIRTGPAVTGTSYYLIYDYLLLEVGADGRLPGGSSSSLALLARQPVPQVTTTPRVWYSIMTVEGNEYFAISYVEPDAKPPGTRYTVEEADDLSAWSTADLVPVSTVVRDGSRTITVRDGVPMSMAPPRFLRVRVSTDGLSAE